MQGQLDILNCGEGHMEIKFDEKDQIETERAKRVIQDMLKRGYSLFIQGEGNELIRVKEFDSKKGVYIIADGATEEPKPIKTKEVRMHKAKAVSVGRSAGG